MNPNYTAYPRYYILIRRKYNGTQPQNALGYKMQTFSHSSHSTLMISPRNQIANHAKSSSTDPLQQQQFNERSLDKEARTGLKKLKIFKHNDALPH